MIDHEICHNILSESERNALLTLIKTKVYNIGKEFPGLQSKPDLHLYPPTYPLLMKIEELLSRKCEIKKCWANYSTGNYTSWHTHPGTFSVVYMVQNKSGLGPWLKKDTETLKTKCPENSFIRFENTLNHTAPAANYNIDRYSVAVEFE